MSDAENQKPEQDVEEEVNDEKAQASKLAGEQPLPSIAKLVVNQVFFLLSIAFQYMGVDPGADDDEVDETKIDLKEAKLAIDLSNMLLKNLEGHISEQESKATEEILANARFRFVSLMKK